MAVFNKNSKKEGMTDNMSRNHLAHGTTVKGEIESEGAVRIDGTVEGTIVSKGKVVIGQQGVIKGNITCAEAEIEGEVNGDIRVQELLYLKATARVIGDLYMKQFVVDKGAIHNGRSNMTSVNGEAAPQMNGQSKQRKVVAAAAN